LFKLIIMAVSKSKSKKKTKPLCQTNIFIQCGSSKKVSKRVPNRPDRIDRLDRLQRARYSRGKSQTQIEVEAEERRRKLAQQDRFLQLEDFRQQREFISNERRIQLGDTRRQTEFISGQNRIVADQQIAQFNQQQANIRAGQSRQLEERKLQEQIRNIRERVGRDDAFRHAQLQEKQRLALEQLAAQRLDNTERIQLEQRRIDNQRAVDAERAITDRELIQTLQASIDRLNRTQEAEEKPIISEVKVSDGEPEPRPQTAEERAELQRREQSFRKKAQKLALSVASSDASSDASSGIPGSLLAKKAQKAAVEAGLRPGPGSSSSSEEVFLSEREQRTEDIRKGKTLAERKALGTPTYIAPTGEEKARFGEGQREAAKQRRTERQRRAAEAGVLKEQQAADTSLRETKPEPEPEGND
jgi:hypothetical protein